VSRLDLVDLTLARIDKTVCDKVTKGPNRDSHAIFSGGQWHSGKGVAILPSIATKKRRAFARLKAISYQIILVVRSNQHIVPDISNTKTKVRLKTRPV